MNFKLNRSELRKFQLEALKNLKILKNAKLEISWKTSALIKLIDNLRQESINRLDSLRAVYFELLSQEYFTRSHLSVIENIKKKQITIQAMDTNLIQSASRKVYSIDIVKYIERDERIRILECNERSIEENKMIGTDEDKQNIAKFYSFKHDSKFNAIDLRQRIELAYRLLRWKNYTRYWQNLNHCQEITKGLLVNNDMNFLFVCKLYLDYTSLGYSWLRIWEISTKNEVDYWLLNDKIHMSSARKWMVKYPEVYFKLTRT